MHLTNIVSDSRMNSQEGETAKPDKQIGR